MASMASGRGRSTFEPLTGFLAQAVGLLARPDPLIILSNALAGVLQCNAGDMEGKGQRDLRQTIRIGSLGLHNGNSVH